MEDDAVTSCFECKISFSFFIRRHHCRACGRIFCEKCSRRRALVHSQMQRVCDHCYDQRKAHREKQDSDAAAMSHQTPLDDTESLHSAAHRDCREVHDGEKRYQPDGEADELHDSSLTTLTLEETYRPKYNWFGSDGANLILRGPVMDVNNQNLDIGTTHKEASHMEDQTSKIIDNQVGSDGTGYEHFDNEAAVVNADNVWSSESFEVNQLFSTEQDLEMRYRNERIMEVASGHFSSLVSFLVSSEGLSAQWKEILSTLAIQACEEVRMTDVDTRDIRRYVKVKKVPGGSRSQSAILRGVTFTRNIVHKKMRDNIEAPRLLLLGCAIEYERDNKFSVLANLAHQEREYLRIAVNKIVAQAPTVVLVEKSVAGVAQLMLLEAKITVVLNVKRVVLERVAQSTGAIIVPSIELLGSVESTALSNKAHRSLGHEEAVGQVVESGQFRVLMEPNQGKPLINIGIAKHWMGKVMCTVVIRGDSTAELERAKAVLLFALYARQCMSTEVAFVRSCGGQVPPDFRLVPLADLPAPAERGVRAQQGAGVSGSSNDNASLLVGGSLPGEPVDLSSEQDAVKGRSSVASRCWDDHHPDSPEYHLLHLSPFFAFKLPSECSRYLQRVMHQKRTAEILQKLTSLADSSEIAEISRSEDEGKEGAQPRTDLLSDAFFVHEIKARSGDRKPHQRLSTIPADKLLDLAPAPGLLWAAPNGSVDSGTMDTLRVLGSSALAAGEAAPCIEPSEMWIRLNGDGDASVGEYLESYCFNAHAICPSKSCGLPMVEHEHSFVHGAARVRVRVSQRNSHRARKSKEIVHRMRCVTCARMTSSGKALPRGALDMSFGRFLQALFYERSLITDDPACPHHLHEQLHSFSQGSMTALFVSEPVTLFDLVLPPLRMEPVEEDMAGRLAQLEFTEIEAGAQRLLDLADAVGGEAARRAQAHVEGLAGAMRRAAAEEGASPELAVGFRRSLFQAASALLDGSEGAPAVASPGDAEPVEPENRGRVEAENRATRDDVDAGEDGTGAGDSDSSDEDAAPAMRDPLHALASAAASVATASSGSDWAHFSPSPVPRSVLATPAAASSSASAPRALVRLLGGGSGRRGGRVSQEQVQAALEGSILSATIGHCCHVNVSIARSPSALSSGVSGDDGAWEAGAAAAAARAVYEDEPSSIIAFALSSPAYARALKHGARGGEEGRERLHIKVAMESEGLAGRVLLRCKAYHARQFDALRRRYCGGRVEDFASALGRCRKWVPTGGKSSAGFVKTVDERFVLKDVSQRELRHLLSSADAYFDYLARTTAAVDTTSRGEDGSSAAAGAGALPSCLVKILGVFKAEWRHVRSGRSAVHVVIVLENLWYTGGRLTKPVTRIFDLKGSARNRFVKEAKEGDVQLDDNFHAYLQRSPLVLSESCKRVLTASVFNDTVFLTAINVMDYSLLVGVDEAGGRVVLGIIDYLRPYTMDKQAEFLYKTAIDRVALKATIDAPTVIPPPEYKLRFRHAMSRDFLAAPSKLSVLRQTRTGQPSI